MAQHSTNQGTDRVHHQHYPFHWGLQLANVSSNDGEVTMASKPSTIEFYNSLVDVKIFTDRGHYAIVCGQRSRISIVENVIIVISVTGTATWYCEEWHTSKKLI